VLTKTAVIFGFLVAFGAGLMVGMRPHVAPDTSPTTRPSGRSGGPMGGWMTAELNLTPVQQEQLKKIWEEPGLRGRGREMDDKRRQFRKERDDAMAALIRPEDKAAFDQIQQDYTDKTGVMESDMRAGFQKLVEHTKEILTAEQREQYEVMLKRFESERGPRDRGRQHGGPMHDPTTRP